MIVFKKSIIILSACILCVLGKGMKLGTSQIFQDSLTVNSNDVADLVIIKADLHNAGTLEAYFTVEANILKELPSEVKLLLRIDKFNSNKNVYEKTPLGIEKNYCRYMKMDKLVYPLLLRKGNFPSKCPVLPGKYYITNYTVTPEDLPISVPPGSYRVTFAYSLEGKQVQVTWLGRSIQG